MAKPWPEARQAVCDWHDLAVAAAWASPNAIRPSDPTASVLANRRVVFDIFGGRFRLIVKADYKGKKISFDFLARMLSTI